MEAHATERSQSYRLRERFEQANVHHGEEVRADLPHVRVAVTNPSLPTWFDRLTGDTTARRAGESEVFFCDMGRIRVREVLEPGDNRPLPTGVVVDGLDVNESGMYDIVNALVRLNGNIRVIVDDRTRVVAATRAFTTALY